MKGTGGATGGRGRVTQHASEESEYHTLEGIRGT